MITTVACIAVYGLGFALGWAACRWDSPAEMARLQKERDAYKKVAESHTVKWEGWPKAPQLVWEQVPGWDGDRRFDDSMEVNLQRLADALALEGNDNKAHLQLHLKVLVSGKWYAYIREIGWRAPQSGWPDPFCELTPLARRFNGSASEIASEVRTLLQDTHLAFHNGLAWKHPSAPIRFVCTLERGVIKASEQPEVRFVEVQVVAPSGSAPDPQREAAAKIAAQLEVDVELAEQVQKLRTGLALQKQQKQEN